MSRVIYSIYINIPKEKLDLLGLKEEYIETNIKSITLIYRFYIYLYIIIGFPFYVYGLLNNYIPYRGI